MTFLFKKILTFLGLSLVGDATPVEKTCDPAENIVFLKTHKTASSTMQNIFFRYGLRTGLRIGIPMKDTHILGWPHYFKSNMLYDQSTTPNIITNHVRFSGALTRMMPQDTKYVTILRSPVSQFNSIFSYYHHRPPFNRLPPKDEGMTQFFQNPSADFFLGRNPNFYDLGEKNINEDKTVYDTIVNRIMDRFDLIMITDYFDESLILLKDELCLDMTDILFFSINVNRPKTEEKQNEELAQKIMEWNAADTALFNAANQTFWNRIEEFGEDNMKRELEEFREERSKLYTMCVESVYSKRQMLKVGREVIERYQSEYTLTEEGKKHPICNHMTMNEPDFNRHVFQEQYGSRVEGTQLWFTCYEAHEKTEVCLHTPHMWIG